MIGPIMVPDKVDDKFEYKIPDNYEFDVVVDGKIILKPIKPKYPNDYKTCCDALYANSNHNECYEACLRGYPMDTFARLLICRDAYWKIAGDEMGLDKPWEPKFGKTVLFDISFYLYQDSFVLHKGEYHSPDNRILVFPTEDMRDAFYENFKDLIEYCKEML
jgi:hypothetical protein